LELDSSLQARSSRRQVRLHSEYREEQVRWFQVVGPSGKDAQIWIEVNENVRVHAWDHKKRRRVLLATSEDFIDRLDEALALIRSWIRP
jgi:hypothetical protein